MKLDDIYHQHHAEHHREGFAILEEERGNLFKKLIGQDKDVLDLGCRDGHLTSYYVQGNRVTGADVDSHALETARERLGITTRHLDVQDPSWPLESASFDVVVAGELLEHVYFPDRVVEQVQKILRSGGMFVGSVPNAFALKNRFRYLLGTKAGTPLEDPMHINHFAWPELKAMLEKYFTEVNLYPLGKSHWGLKEIVPQFFSFGIAFSARKT